MNFRSTHNGDGEAALPGSDAASPSAGPPGSSRLIPFPVAAAAKGRDTEGAGVSSASASSFVPLGDAVHAVVLRLRGDFPRIRVSGQLGGGSRPLDDQREGEDR